MQRLYNALNVQGRNTDCFNVNFKVFTAIFCLVVVAAMVIMTKLYLRN